MAAKSFEKSIEALESIVEELESGDLSLEASIKKFEEGVKLSKNCSKKLDETEKKISILLADNNGGVVEQPFDETD